jgi:ketosteroid isomerase-like protein
LPHQAGAKATEHVVRSPEELVRLAYTAFQRSDADALRRYCHGSIEVQPVDALGLVGDTLLGFEAARRWMQRCNKHGFKVKVWVRTLEEVTCGRVLGVGVVSEKGRGCAATVAWIWHVRDGLIDSVSGYPNEAAARRALCL